MCMCVSHVCLCVHIRHVSQFFSVLLCVYISLSSACFSSCPSNSNKEHFCLPSRNCVSGKIVVENEDAIGLGIFVSNSFSFFFFKKKKNESTDRKWKLRNPHTFIFMHMSKFLLFGSDILMCQGEQAAYKKQYLCVLKWFPWKVQHVYSSIFYYLERNMRIYVCVGSTNFIKISTLTDFTIHREHDFIWL